jgi:hypothetical protein
MSIVDKVTAPIKRYLITKGLVKVAKRLGQLIASFLAAQQLAQYGIDVSPEQATAGIYALAEFVRNFLKTKWPEKFGWL